MSQSIPPPAFDGHLTFNMRWSIAKYTYILEQVEEISQLDNVHIANNKFNCSRKLNEERLAYLILIVKLILPSSLPEQKLVSLFIHTCYKITCTTLFEHRGFNIRLKWELRTNNPIIFDSRRIGIRFDPDVDFSDFSDQMKILTNHSPDWIPLSSRKYFFRADAMLFRQITREPGNSLVKKSQAPWLSART